MTDDHVASPSPPSHFDCFTPIEWLGTSVRLIDQRQLPTDEVYLTLTDWEGVAHSIKEMVVRGAPAIGISAAYALVLAAQTLAQTNPEASPEEIELFMENAKAGLAATRPTAVNLFWALERVSRLWMERGSVSSTHQLKELCIQEALKIHKEDVEMCRAMGKWGAELLDEDVQVLTHCNTGALATGGYGTALGVIRAAWTAGKLRQVYADETRPFLQGSRLTAWELHRDGIPTKVICDHMSAYLMNRGVIDAVFVGADRIAANGDVANKIGTYGLAIISRAHEVPFYVVAPTSTVDLNTPNGAAIPIEQRDPREVIYCGDRRVSPKGVEVENPAFDITPADYITAIITERGVIQRGRFTQGLKSHLAES